MLWSGKRQNTSARAVIEENKFAIDGELVDLGFVIPPITIHNDLPRSGVGNTMPPS